MYQVFAALNGAAWGGAPLPSPLSPFQAAGTVFSYMKFTVAPVAQARTGTFTFWPTFDS